MALLAVLAVQTRYHQAQVKDTLRQRARDLSLDLQAEVAEQLEQDFAADVSRVRSPLSDALDFEAAIEVEPNHPTTPTLKKVTVILWWRDRQGEQTTRLWCYYDSYP